MIILSLVLFLIFVLSANQTDKHKDKWLQNPFKNDVYEPHFVWSLLKTISLALAVFILYIAMLMKTN